MFSVPLDSSHTPHIGDDFALYCDLDGVFADYDSGIRAFGFEVDGELKKDLNRSGTNHPLKREMYERIKGTDFYERLPILPGAAEFFRDHVNVNPFIVTAAPKFGATEDDYHLNPYWLGAAYHKRRWMEHIFLPEALWSEVRGHGRLLKKRVPDRIQIADEHFICTTSKRKQEFMHRKKSHAQVLVEDRVLNCFNWAKAGGCAVLHDGDFDRTRDHVSDVVANHSHIFPDGYDSWGAIAGIKNAWGSSLTIIPPYATDLEQVLSEPQEMS